MAEAHIRQRVEDLVKALNAKDIDGVISLFAPARLAMTWGAYVGSNGGQPDAAVTLECDTARSG